MRARNVLLALIMIAVGTTITAARRGVFADWERTLRAQTGGIDELVRIITGAEPDEFLPIITGSERPVPGYWQAVSSLSRNVPALNAASLTVRDPNGQVTVAGQEQDKVQVRAVVYGRGEHPGEVRTWANTVQLDTYRSGDAVIINVGNRSTGSANPWRYSRIDLVITTPPNLDLSVSGVSGSVEVRGMKRAVDVETVSGETFVNGGVRAKASSVSGDISLSNIRGSTQARSMSGSLRLENLSDDMKFSTVSGSIRGNNLRGPLSAKTISGDVILDNYSGSPTDIKTTSGKMDASLSQPLTGQLFAHSISGSISLAIPSGSDCIADISSTSGDVRISGFPGERRGSWGRRRVRGALGAGTGRLELGTISGSVTVTEKPGAIIRKYSSPSAPRPLPAVPQQPSPAQQPAR